MPQVTARDSSRSIPSKQRARSFTSPGRCTSPAGDVSCIPRSSGNAPEADATTGTPAAIASITGIPFASGTGVGIANTSISSNSLIFSLRSTCPLQKNRSAIPSSWASAWHPDKYSSSAGMVAPAATNSTSIPFCTRRAIA